jgi:hypothetical protein
MVLDMFSALGQVSRLLEPAGAQHQPAARPRLQAVLTTLHCLVQHLGFQHSPRLVPGTALACATASTGLLPEPCCCNVRCHYGSASLFGLDRFPGGRAALASSLDGGGGESLVTQPVKLSKGCVIWKCPVDATAAWTAQLDLDDIPVSKV